MRKFAIVHAFLIGIVVWAAWQSVSHKSSVPPVIEMAAKPADQPAPQAAAEPAKTEAPAPQAVAPAAPALTATAAAEPPKPAAAPANQTASQSEVKPVEQPALQTASQPETKPVEQKSAAESTVHADAKPAVANPAEPAPAAQAASAADAAMQQAAQPPSPDAAKPPVQEAALKCDNPDAIGTSRVLTINPGEFTLLGSFQYKQTLPLKDHEVVLTFDDGPIPPYTTSVLDTLASQCVKATYFLVGEMAQQRPYLVRRIYNEGHSIGTHSQHHPFAFQRLSMQRVEREVDGGIDSVKGALGDAAALSPFFRIPGFGRTNAIDQYLEDKKLVVWSTDVDTDDWWRGSTPGAIVQRAMRRLNEKGRGIILMHDIHPATALALPLLLKELKANGYKIVHVVAAGEQPKSLPDAVATAGEKEAWPRVLHANAEQGGPSKRALRHRVKQALNGHHRRRAERKDVAKAEDGSTGSVSRHFTRSY